MSADVIDVTPQPEDRTVAILSYITIIGFIVAIVMHGNKPTRLGAFHLRQTLGLLVIGISASVLLGFIPLIGWAVGLIVWAGLFVAWLLGVIAAASGRMTPTPLLGEKFQSWFSGAFA